MRHCRGASIRGLMGGRRDTRGRICCVAIENAREITMPEHLKVDSDVGRGGLLAWRRDRFAGDNQGQSSELCTLSFVA